MSHAAVILDQHPLWLDAVEPVVTKAGIRVVGKTTVPREALALVESEQPDLLVAEVQTSDPELSGFDCIRQAIDAAPSLKVIVLAVSADPEDIATAFAAGAVAYVVKTAHPDDIAAALRQPFDPSMFFADVHTLGQARSGRGTLQAGSDDDSHGLTRRELEILALVAEGHSNGQMARKLWVTEQTVKFHLSNIYRKLDVANRTEAASWAHRHQLVAEAVEIT